MAKQRGFRDSVHAAYLMLENIEVLLTKLEETTYLRRSGLSYPQFLILLATEASKPPVSETDVAGSVQHNLNTVSMIIDRMAKLGLVKRVRSGKDRREVHVSLTPLGREKLHRGVEVGVAIRERLGNAFSDEEMQRAMLLMGKMSNQLHKDTGREPIPVDATSPLRENVLEIFRKYGPQKTT